MAGLGANAKWVSGCVGPAAGLLGKDVSESAASSKADEGTIARSFARQLAGQGTRSPLSRRWSCYDLLTRQIPVSAGALADPRCEYCTERAPSCPLTW